MFTISQSEKMSALRFTTVVGRCECGYRSSPSTVASARKCLTDHAREKHPEITPEKVAETLRVAEARYVEDTTPGSEIDL